MGRGQAHFHIKEWTAALADFEQALTLDPELADAHAWRGHILAELGDYDSGIEALRDATDLDETDLTKQIWLAQALLDSGSYSAAKAAFSSVLSLGPPSAEAYVGRAMAEAALGDLEATQVNLSHAMSTAPFDPSSLHGRAWFYITHQQENLYEAGQLALQAVDGAKNDLDKARYLHTLARIYTQQGYREQAIAALEEAVALATIEDKVVYEDILAYLQELRPGSE